MSNFSEREARCIWRELLQKFLGDPVKEVEKAGLPWAEGWDDVLHCAGFRFAVEYKVRADTAAVAASLEKVRQRVSGLPKGFHPLLVVNHMGRTGSELCAREGMDWLDLAGNASLTHLPRTRIIIEGKEPEFRARGRRSNVFATKSSRVAHWLLLHQNRTHNHQEIVEATGLDKGHLSRILSRLEDLRLIHREKRGIRMTKPAVMLDAWQEAYEPPCGNILKGVIPSRSGEETVKIVEAGLRSARKKYAFGGLSSAWIWDAFADFRLATCYVEGIAGTQLLEKIGFVETERGANIWFMQEADEVAFLGCEKRERACVASPWFTYVDLSIHPERAREAAAHLRDHILKVENLHGS